MQKMTPYCKNTYRRLRTLLVGIVLIVFGINPSLAWADLSPRAMSKAPPAVLQKMAKGESQKVIVLFEDSELQQEVMIMRKAAKLNVDDESVLSHKKRQFDAIKTRVFTQGSHLGLRKVKDYSHLPMMYMDVPNRKALEQLLEDPNVAAVYENQVHQNQLAESLPLINQPSVQAIGIGGRGTTVAVIDTGVDYNSVVFHPNGKRCNAPGAPNCRVVFAADFAPDDGLRDSDGHGTLVAAIVAGVAPDARIAALDAYRSNGYYDVDVAAAFNWVIQNARTYNIVAMNLSFGGGVFGGGM